MSLRRLWAIWRLARFKGYVFFVTPVSVLPVLLAGAELSLSFGLLWLANALSLAFAFMINDVEDAPDDALDPGKRLRNPVSSGDISYKEAMIISWAIGILSAVLYAMLGPKPLILGSLAILISFLYSWRQIRLKRYVLVDIVSHGMILGGLQFSAGLALYQATNYQAWLLLVTLLAGSFFGQLYNQIKDYQNDQAAGLRNSTWLLGLTKAVWLQRLLFSVAVVFTGIVLATAEVPLYAYSVFLVTCGGVWLVSALLQRSASNTTERLIHAIGSGLSVAALSWVMESNILSVWHKVLLWV